MMHQEIIGACGPVGCAPPGLVSPYYNPYYGAGPGLYGGGGFGFPGGGQNLEIVGQQSRLARFGQEVPPATPPVTPPGTGTGTGAPTTGEQAQDWLARESFVGVTNRNLLLIAAAAGLGWYAFSEGWFGGGRRSSSDRDRGTGRRRSSSAFSMDDERDRRGGRGRSRSGGGRGSRSGGSRGRQSRDFVWF